MAFVTLQTALAALQSSFAPSRTLFATSQKAFASLRTPFATVANGICDDRKRHLQRHKRNCDFQN